MIILSLTLSFGLKRPGSMSQGLRMLAIGCYLDLLIFKPSVSSSVSK